MRYLALLLLMFLASCDSSTNSESIPSEPNAPLLTLTVLTGTKTAPVDSPTVKVKWTYRDTLQIVIAAESKINGPGSVLVFPKTEIGSSDTVIKAGCYGSDSAIFYANATAFSSGADTTFKTMIYCK